MTNVKYVEDFCSWINVAGKVHRLPEKEIAKCFVSSLKPDVFHEEIYSRTFETLEDVIRELGKSYLPTVTFWKYISDRI